MNSEQKEGSQGRHWTIGPALAILLAVATFVTGLKIGNEMPEDSSLQANLFGLLGQSARPDEDADLREFWRVWNILEDKFVTASSTPNNTDRIRGAIAGLVDSYNDPYTVYMPPEDAEQFAEDIGGQFSGVGMEVGLRNDLITVIAPLPKSPAETAGVQSGDVVAKIDGKTTEKMTVDEAVRLIRGEKGTEVNLTLYREGATELLEKKIVRDVITVPTLVTEEKGDVFIIRLYSFNALSESQMNKAVLQFAEKKYKKLVLDLRGNPGGYLESAVSIAGYFMEPGKVVVRENFGGEQPEQAYRTEGRRIVELAPENFVILIDGGSASASEILAGALSEHKVATTIGNTTFGKGSVQELIELPDDSAVKVTVARWFTPEGISISEKGLEPNVKVERTPQDVTAGKDPQQEAALKWLAGDREIGEKVGME